MKSRNLFFIFLMIILTAIHVFGQKQSLYSQYPSLVHQDVMNDEYSTRSLGGVPTAITYSLGKASFNGTTSNITYRSVNGVKSVRLKLTLATTTQAVLTLSATHSISVSSGTISATGFSSPTIYVNGTVSSTITTVESEIVITTATAINANLFVLGNISSSYLNGSVNFIEIGTRALSLPEISNMYLGVHHKDLPQNQAEVLGSELVTNGGFNTDISGWTNHATYKWDTAEWTTNGLHLVSNGVNETSVFQAFYQSLNLSSGKTYKITYNVKSITGNCALLLENTPVGASLGYGKTIGSAGVISEYFTTSSSATFVLNFYRTSTNAVDLVIDDISCKEVLSASTPLLIDFNSTAGQIKSSVGNVWTASNATTKRAGSIFSSSFNGTTSYLSTPNVNLSGNITVIGWFKMDSFGQNNLGNILNDTKLVVRVNSTNSVLQLSRDNSTYASSATNALQAGKVYLFACTSTNAGVTNFYLADAKGSVVASGTANQSAGTPSNGSTILIGNNSTSSPTRTFKGIIPKVQIFGSILTVNQITQSWSNLMWMMQ